MLFFSYRPCSSLSLWFSPFNDGARSINLQEQLKLRLIYDAQWMKNRETDRLDVDKRGHVPRLRPEVGDEVLVWVDSTGDKFKYSWRGPYTVMDYTDKGQVVLEGLKRPQAISNVKVYHRNKTIDGSLTNNMGDALPKELRRLDGVTQNDFLMTNGSLYQVVSVNHHEAILKAVKVTIEDSVLIYSDEVCEFDMICTDTLLVPGIRVTNGTVSLSRMARRMLNDSILQ
ncbi:hypothetical protein Pmar_PMAR015755 [Perkinsus marinus ATCC 50983]|uniref:Uncharacterized protein n=1 Tax=Perkinsus marinus (strain ATCC 50983 / TXsc) TaxID=423536 RepID=C5L476_PERM5|nr:hypothetical protein Pmar_PMAR015755 [Perkinsus marinus ATCC 50983]EER08467.1 hypothetical protein Pmar_PMAR015755 [Perkinsus marinus ATCC 50983]|eukprot:XP_002776651.1 hypothetical protein Pmar_PMAR015755 [Perkinsus marinus ATCC 50983]